MPRLVAVIIRGVTGNLPNLFSPLSSPPLLYSPRLYSLPVSPGKPILSVSMCYSSVAGSRKDNSVLWHTSSSSSSSASTVLTGEEGRGGGVLPRELWEHAECSQPLTALVRVRGKRPRFKADHLGEAALLDGGGREGEVGKEERERKKGGEGKLEGRRSRERKWSETHLLR